MAMGLHVRIEVMASSRRSFIALSLSAIPAVSLGGEDTDMTKAIDRERPMRPDALVPSVRDRVGTTLVAGKYHLTGKPNLTEGAEKMLELGTRLGKFWFDPSRAATDYPFNSDWPQMATLRDLAASPYWSEVFRMPFKTLILIAESPIERGWKGDQDDPFYERITKEFEDLTTHLFEKYGDRDLVVILQNWEGDWQLRGTGETWNPPPENWRTLCGRFVKRLAARQAGVSRARDRFPGARLKVLHAAEVNRVRDQWEGIPTMAEHVLPHVDLDLVSYSCYDAMKDGITLYKAISTVAKFARTNGEHGPGAVYLGEIGIPENIAKERIKERWDELLGAAFAADVKYVAQWELYCNELNPKFQPHPKPPITEGWRMRGFWLLEPDGSLSQSGEFFRELWKRAGA